jgi:RNA polymerase sigma-70 factor, ECF subfamily
MSLAGRSIEASCATRLEPAGQRQGPAPFTQIESPNGLSQDSAPAETQLIDSVAQGDRDAFAVLYDRYSKPLYSLAVRILGDRVEAEDLLQEVFLEIWEKAQSFEATAGHPFSWAATITRNKSIRRLRARRRSRGIEGPLDNTSVVENTSEAPPGEIYRRDNSGQICAALSQLPHDQRRPIELAFFGGLTSVEIAEALQEPVDTIKARIRLGMMRLRDGLASI